MVSLVIGTHLLTSSLVIGSQGGHILGEERVELCNLLSR
jgi:hypothetical protein